MERRNSYTNVHSETVIKHFLDTRCGSSGPSRSTHQDGTDMQEIYWGKWLWRIKRKGVRIDKESLQIDASVTLVKGEKEEGLGIKVSDHTVLLRKF